MTLIINSILAGTWGLTAALLLVQMLGMELNSRSLIISTMRNLLLFGSAVYLVKTGINIFHAHMSFTSVEFWIMFLSWPLVFGVLPQLLWFKPFRQRLASLAVIVAVWTITVCFVPWTFTQVVTNLIMHPAGSHTRIEFSFIGYLEMVAVYAVLFALIYQGLTRRNVAIPPQNQDELTDEQAHTAQAA